MHIERTNALTEQQKRQAEALERVCLEHDALKNHAFLTNEINYDRSIPVFFLAYEGEALTGVLAVFIPTHEEAEISAFVHPAYRQKGIFTALCGEARRIIAENGIDRVLYSVETGSASAEKVLLRWHIDSIARSEYRMVLSLRDIKVSGITPPCGEFSARRMTYDSIEDYKSISERAYGEDGADYANTLITSDTRMGYVLYRHDTPVGVFVIGIEEPGGAFIYGVAIAESERGKGFGRVLMEHACAVSARYGDSVQLDVDSDNPVAYHLYSSMGFKTVLQVDYYIG